MLRLYFARALTFKEMNLMHVNVLKVCLFCKYLCPTILQLFTSMYILLLLCIRLSLAWLLLWPLHNPTPLQLLVFVSFLFLSQFLSLYPFLESMVCPVPPPASQSAPSFLRHYAGGLGRGAMRRDGLDRPYLSLHRTGSLGDSLSFCLSIISFHFWACAEI